MSDNSALRAARSVPTEQADRNVLAEAELRACRDRREKASKTVVIGRQKVKRFLPLNAPDDGTLRCISCGQIDDEPWHDPALCPALVMYRAITASDDTQPGTETPSSASECAQ